MIYFAPRKAVKLLQNYQADIHTIISVFYNTKINYSDHSLLLTFDNLDRL